MKKLQTLVALLLASFAISHADNIYFVDGYHGGIYGHYPVEWKTQFIVDQVKKNPKWRIGLEIEPETWDTVKVKTPEAYRQFSEIVRGNQVEYTNPSVAQAYLYNVSGESIIRQFQYGMKKLRGHFPGIEFNTYAVEEPCFTSALPMVLKQLGFKYVVLKCPNTCWGGYPAAFGNGLVNLIGPDGTSMLAMPRYECEDLQSGSVWQTTAWGNTREYIQACREAGIVNPVGMTYQDAGWRNGPWLGKRSGESIYTLWTDYFKMMEPMGATSDWHYSAEDVLPGLMWGSQVMQRIGQTVRSAENNIVMAEKMAAIGYVNKGYKVPQTEIDEAWRTLMMSQHHDSWIVPYNGLHGKGTWADWIVKRWTPETERVAAKEMKQVMGADGTECLRVYNTLAYDRAEVACVEVPEDLKGFGVTILDSNGKAVESLVKEMNGKKYLFFTAKVPALGYATYKVVKSNLNKELKDTAPVNMDEYVLENSMYRMVLDLTRGGTVKSLIMKKENNREMVDASSEYAFGEARGFFYNKEKFYSTTESRAALRVLIDTPFMKTVEVTGEIAGHPYRQVVTLTEGNQSIEFAMTFDWKGNEGIGEYLETRPNDRRRAYCDDRYKLNIVFPSALKSDAKIYKDAPFDVCESRYDNTFFKSWDEIKNNIILHWVDLSEGKDGYGVALFTDHTTSYLHGEDYPLGLTAQYSGRGLWGRDYKISGPTTLHYAIVPHAGMWDKAHLQHINEAINEPLKVAFVAKNESEADAYSMLNLEGTGYQVSAMTVAEGKITLRLYNAEGCECQRNISLNVPVKSVTEVDLDGNVVEAKTLIDKGSFAVKMPRFAIKTFEVALK